MTFDEALQRVLGHEGGYVDSPYDPGGETKYGISKSAHPGEDIANLTLVRARQIYLRDYWGPAGCDAVPDAIKFDLFDTAVNSGVKTAAKLLQRAVGAEPDGIIGPRTLQAINSTHPARVVARFNGARLAYMASLPHWDRFSEGWAKRIAANLMEA